MRSAVRELQGANCSPPIQLPGNYSSLKSISAGRLASSVEQPAFVPPGCPLDVQAADDHCGIDVRFTPNTGHVQCNSVCLLSARSGHPAKPQRPILGHCRRISEMIRNRRNLFFRRSDTKVARSESSLILRRYFGLSSTYSTDVSSGYQAFRGSTLSCVERTVSTSSTAALSEGVGD